MTETDGRLSGEQARVRLYEVMRADCPAAERIRRALEIGTEYFGVEYGFVTEVDEGTDEWEIVASTDEDDGVVPEGLDLPLSTTYCYRTIQQDGILALEDTRDRAFEGDVSGGDGIACYHGAPVIVDGRTSGTVCFVSSTARSDRFTDSEKAFTDLVAGMIGHEFERRQREAELDAREHELREREEIYRATIDASFDMVFRIDTDGTYTYQSPGTADLLGYRPAELVGESFRMLLADEATVETAETIFERVLAGETVREQYLPVEAADGSVRYLDVQVTPVYDADVPAGERDASDVVAVQGTAHDATDRKRRERLVRVLNRVLRHNLRNDMTVVGGLAETLERRLDGEDGELAGRIRRASDRLLELGETARRLERNIDDPPGVEPTDVVPMVVNASKGVGERYPDASITVDAPTSALASGAPRLETALWELLDNAASHGGGAVEVSVTVADDRVRIVVADDGPGLPDGERAVLTSGEETPLIHGSGLGLWLVHWIVTGLGGELTVPDSDAGTEIEIRLGRPGTA